jgi:hypothetical protein
VGHLCDQLADLTGKPSGAHRASDPVLDIAKALASRHGASARPYRAGRSSGCRAIGATSARTRSKTTDPNGESTGDEFRYAPARRFDDIERSLLAAARCGSGRTSGDRDRCACRRRHACRLSPRDRKPPMNSSGLSFEEPQGAATQRLGRPSS